MNDAHHRTKNIQTFSKSCLLRYFCTLSFIEKCKINFTAQKHFTTIHAFHRDLKIRSTNIFSTKNFSKISAPATNVCEYDICFWQKRHRTLLGVGLVLRTRVSHKTDGDGGVVCNYFCFHKNDDDPDISYRSTRDNWIKRFARVRLYFTREIITSASPD